MLGLGLRRTHGVYSRRFRRLSSGRDQLRVGDRVYLRHVKAGELCERFNSLYLVTGLTIRDEVPTYRGEGKSFL